MGQAAWFMNFHPEKVPSAIERYQNETLRVMGVIDGWLKKNNLKYLVADEENPEGKCTFADIAFVSWSEIVVWILGRDPFEDGSYGAYKQWMDRLRARPAVKEALEEKAKKMEEAH